MRHHLLRVIAGILLLSFVGCQRNGWLLGNHQQRVVVLKIKAIDSTTFSQYYTLSFRSRSGKRGDILIDKQGGFLPDHLFPGTEFQPLMLRDVIEFRMDSISLRGHIITGGFYVDGERHIDLSNAARRPLYSLVPQGEIIP
ncbi:hypothetical protein FUA23_03015 [Neolewinella aurantiaca]|uniref:Lipoprotein n=1 Tax=Neolewinella aurantiaca TaxID=2602767 RepID=A0A5C7FXK9_9BACT|nr:hypothetical protein [Neolewinella aurantiaca]TXF91209.1 hypothetical protein FUA23_03015 [Neolewinella aurantiaca]